MLDYERSLARLEREIRLPSNGIIDPPHLHHEFVRGGHGRKADMDKISTGSPLYHLWMRVMSQAVRLRYGNNLPPVVVGVANGANRVARSAAADLGDEVEALKTKKLNREQIILTRLSRMMLELLQPDWALVLDDIASTGSSTALVVDDLYKAGVKNVEVAYTGLRIPTLPYLEERGVTYWGAIDLNMPTFTKEACQSNPAGLCYNGVELIPYKH